MSHADLALAIVCQAMRDAAGNSMRAIPAREWLISDDARSLTEPLEIDNLIDNWIAKGCPKPDGRLERYDKISTRDWHAYYQNKREK